MIIGGHFMHYDHGGNIPALVKQNPNIRIITGKNTTGILKEMWLDSANITIRDCETLSSQYSDKVFKPLYNIDDVEKSVSLIEEYDVGEIHELDENISIRYTYSGHIFGAVQCELFIKIKNHCTKLLFTSDLGNTKIQDLKPFVQKFEPIKSANYVFGETTYGARNNKQITQKIINKDLEEFEREFKVRRMNYDQVVVNYPSDIGLKVFDKKDVEYIKQTEIDEFLIKYSDFLKIKLNRGISIALYKALLESIEAELDIIFENLNLLKDKYEVNKRGVWEKEILAVINYKIPVKLITFGQNFKKSGFNISIEIIEEKEFFEICKFEINKIQEEIKEKERILSRYGMAIEKMKDTENLVKMLE